MQPRVSIVIPCLNKLEFTQRCVAALLQTIDLRDHQLILVDNASSDGTPSYLMRLEAELPNTLVVHNDHNLGFGGGNNRGVEQASGEYLFLLNNDTEVQPGWLTPLLSRAQSAPDIGAVGAKLIYPDGRMQEAGGLVFSDGSAWNFGRFDDPHDPEYEYVREVDYCSAAALLVRTDVYRALGGFDPRYDPAYYEDVDLCFALRQNGYRVLFEPRSRVTHYEGVTGGTSNASGAKRYQQINAQKFAQKWAAVLGVQPPPPANQRDGRHASDRRRRNGRQLLIVLDEQPPTQPSIRWRQVPATVRDLLDSGHHVTLAYRDRGVPEHPEITMLRDAGALVFPLRQTPLAPPDALLQAMLQQRNYDMALVWTAHAGRWVADQVRIYSPRTRVMCSIEPAKLLPIFVPLAGSLYLGVPEEGQSTNGVEQPTVIVAKALETVQRNDMQRIATGITVGSGFYGAEGDWRWMSITGRVFVWSEAVQVPSVLSFELQCSEAEYYALFPFDATIYHNGGLTIKLTFSAGQQCHTVRIPLQPISDDVCVRIESGTGFVPVDIGIGPDARTLSLRMSAPRLQTMAGA